MDILVKPFILDTIIIFFVMIMMILGYKKGFIVRLYDFVTTLLALMIASSVSYPMSKVWTIYQIEPPLEKLGETVNHFLVYIMIFIIFKCACKILGLLIKPVIQKICSLFKITEFLNSLLGLLLSVLESALLIYLALVIVVSPVFSGGKEMIQQSILGSFLIKAIPLYTQEIMEFDMIQDYMHLDLDTKDTASMTLVTEVLFQLDENDMIDDESLKTFMINYYQDVDQVSLSQETYDLIEKMCRKNHIDSQDLLKGIIVSDENEE